MRTFEKTPWMLAFLLAASLPAWAEQNLDASEERVSRAEDRRAVAVTIYNESIALIREEREIDVRAGFNRLALREVPARIQPETASFSSLSGDAFSLLEQNFDFDLLTPEKLLDKYVGKSVTVIHKSQADGAERRETAEVLAHNKGVVLRYPDRIETGLPENARIAYGELPPNLRDRPTLIVDFDAEKAGRQRAALSYLSEGFNWRADYVATLADNEQTLNLAGWVTLTNQSGASFENAQLQLVAGEPNRVKPPPAAEPMYAAETAVRQRAAPLVQEESFFEYHLYTLARPTTLRDQQTKQVALLSAANIPVRKEYRVQHDDFGWFHKTDDSFPEDGEKHPVAVVVSFDNREGDLGIPLPKGIVRVYKNDARGQSQFSGEDEIDHTPKNETVRLKLGTAFDVTARWKRVNFRRVSRNVTEATLRLELANAKTEAINVVFVETLFGQWKILKESHPHEKPSSQAALWKIPVPAGGKTTLDYQVRFQ